MKRLAEAFLRDAEVDPVGVLHSALQSRWEKVFSEEVRIYPEGFSSGFLLNEARTYRVQANISSMAKFDPALYAL